ncbi:unnamed protein product [Discosporangium mesarthrocarpum]
MGASPEEVRKMIVAFPTLFNLSIEDNVVPKLTFFREGLGGNKDEVCAAVVKTPAILGYSMTGRLSPRLCVIKKNKLQVSFAQHYWHVTSYTDRKFKMWLGQEIAEVVRQEGGGIEERQRRAKDSLRILRGQEPLL